MFSITQSALTATSIRLTTTWLSEMINSVTAKHKCKPSQVTGDSRSAGQTMVLVPNVRQVVLTVLQTTIFVSSVTIPFISWTPLAEFVTQIPTHQSESVEIQERT